MKNKNKFLIILLLLLLVLIFLIYRWYSEKSNNLKKPLANTKNNIINQSNKPSDTNDYLLDGYPIETIPLYKLKKISSAKFFVNKDPKRLQDYFGKAVNYFNIVFVTDSDASETLNYYQSLMSEQDSNPPGDRIQGKIGKYKVSVGQYADSDTKDVYLQAYLPSEEYQDINPYYQDYPTIVDLEKELSEYESSYGLLNQKGGEVEYSQYFQLPADEEDIDKLIKKYQEKYQVEQGFVFNDKSGLMNWKKDVYTVNMTFSKDHGRIYLMIRRPM